MRLISKISAPLTFSIHCAKATDTLVRFPCFWYWVVFIKVCEIGQKHYKWLKIAKKMWVFLFIIKPIPIMIIFLPPSFYSPKVFLLMWSSSSILIKQSSNQKSYASINQVKMESKKALLLVVGIDRFFVSCRSEKLTTLRERTTSYLWSQSKKKLTVRFQHLD